MQGENIHPHTPRGEVSCTGEREQREAIRRNMTGRFAALWDIVDQASAEVALMPDWKKR